MHLIEYRRMKQKFKFDIQIFFLRFDLNSHMKMQPWSPVKVYCREQYFPYDTIFKLNFYTVNFDKYLK